jgi:hypothetical protein
MGTGWYTVSDYFPPAAITKYLKAFGLELYQTYYLTVLQVRSLKWVGKLVFWEALGKTPFPCLFQLLEATCAPWLIALSPTLASLVTSPLVLILLRPLSFTIMKSFVIILCPTSIYLIIFGKSFTMHGSIFTAFRNREGDIYGGHTQEVMKRLSEKV